MYTLAAQTEFDLDLADGKYPCACEKGILHRKANAVVQSLLVSPAEVARMREKLYGVDPR